MGISNEVNTLHMLVFGLCVVVANVVFAAMIWSVVRHRRSGNEPAAFSHSMRAELAWSIIPIAILIAVAMPATDMLIRMGGAGGDELNVKVVGYQWKWEYEYLDHGIRYVSMPAPVSKSGRVYSPDALSSLDRPLVVPAGAKVHVVLTSNDVNHAWYVPGLGRKRNAIPGHQNEFSFRARTPGTFQGECAEFCGPGETCMPVAVEVLPPGEFAAWLEDNGRSVHDNLHAAAPVAPGLEPVAEDLATMMARGQSLHASNCAGCHQASGQGLRAAGFPPLAGTRVSRDEHIKVALHGRPGSAMVAFGTLLGDEELAAIVTFQRNAWGNDTGDLVRPADIAAAR